MVDVPIAVDIPCADEIFQNETTPRPCDVLDWNFHGAEFIEFVVFDVLAMDTGGLNLNGPEKSEIENWGTGK
jgi:hypothetical protein